MRQPTVVLDATAVPADRGGVGRYVDSLVRALVVLDGDPIVLATRHDVPVFEAMGVRRVRGIAPASRGRVPRLVWEQTGLPGVLRSLGADVVHSPHYTMPLRSDRARVVTLHDATFFTDPGLHTGRKAVAFRAATRNAVQRADRCVVPSRATRDELVRLLPGADPGRILVVPHGVDSDVFRPPTAQQTADFAARLGLTGRRWIAFLGTLEPRKNVPNLIRGWVHAFAEIAAASPSAAPVLVLAGGRGWDAGIEPALDLVPPAMTVLRPGYLPVADLPALLAGADVVAYPSLGEGFGLPVLEAMACGASVLTTRRLSLPEVGGSAVAYCEPGVASIAAALSRLVDDDDRRAAIGAAARLRAADFTWRSCALAHLQAWQAAAAQRHGRPAGTVATL